MSGTSGRGARTALVILKALVAAGGPVRTSLLLSGVLLSGAAGSRATVYRTLAALRSQGLVERRERGSAALGPLAVGLAIARDRLLQERDAARVSRRAAGARIRRTPSFLPLRHPDALEATPPRAGTRRGKLRIGFSNASLDNPWRVALVHSIEFACARYAGEIATLQVWNAGDDPQVQARDIAGFSGDGLIVSATHGPFVAEALAVAAARGVPVVLVDRGVPIETPYASNVGTDNFAIGHTTALWLAEHLGGEGRVACLPGREDAEPARQRLAGARAALAAFPGIRLFGPWWTGWQRDRAFALVRGWLKRGEAIDGVWCDSGLQGAGSIDAFLEAGRPPGGIPPHTGGDLNRVYKLALRHAIPLASRDYPPAMGLKAVEVLLDSLQGRAVARRTEVASEIVVTRGHATRSVHPDLFADERVRWDLADDLILATGLGQGYDPLSFRVNYPGNRYNRSVAGSGAAHAV